MLQRELLSRMLKLRVLHTKEARELSLLSINGMPLKRIIYRKAAHIENQTDIKLYTICRDSVYFGKIRSETQQDI